MHRPVYARRVRDTQSRAPRQALGGRFQLEQLPELLAARRRMAAADVAQQKVAQLAAENQAVQQRLATLMTERDALQAAAARIRTYHERQLDACGRSWSYREADGTLVKRDRTEIEHFPGPHTINGQGTFEFLHKHLGWPKRGDNEGGGK